MRNRVYDFFFKGRDFKHSTLTRREKLSLCYALFSFSAFTSVIYAYTQGKIDLAGYYGLKTEEEEETPSAVQWAQILKLQNATVMRYDGLKKVETIRIVDGNPVYVKDAEKQSENVE